MNNLLARTLSGVGGIEELVPVVGEVTDPREGASATFHELTEMEAEADVLEGDIRETSEEIDTVASTVTELEASVEGVEAFLTGTQWNPSAFKAVYDRASELSRELGVSSSAVLGAESLSSQGLATMQVYAGVEGFVSAIKEGVRKLIALINDLIASFKAWLKNLLGRKSVVELRNKQILKGAQQILGKDAEQIEINLNDEERKVFYIDHESRVLKMMTFPKENNLVMNTLTDILDAATKMKNVDDVMTLKAPIQRLTALMESGKLIKTTRTQLQGKVSSSTLSRSDGVKFQMSAPEGNPLSTPKEIAEYLRDTWIVLANDFTIPDDKSAFVTRKQLQGFLEESQRASETLPDAQATINRVNQMITATSRRDLDVEGDDIKIVLMALRGALQLHVGAMQRYARRVIAANHVTGELVRRSLEKMRKGNSE